MSIGQMRGGFSSLKCAPSPLTPTLSPGGEEDVALPQLSFCQVPKKAGVLGNRLTLGKSRGLPRTGKGAAGDLTSRGSPPTTRPTS